MSAQFGGWELEELRDYWPDAPTDDATLERLLNIADLACDEYAPAPDIRLRYGPRYADSYKEAVFMQCRNTWNSSMVDPSNGAIGDDTYTIRPFPLDWMVKQLLRPKAGPLAWVG